jgi:hypothetical protein
MRLPEEPRLPPELPRLVLRLTDVLRDITRAINSIADQSTSTAVADLIGTALSMTITPKAPTSAETPGALNLLARDAVGAGIDGGSVSVTAGSAVSGAAGGSVQFTAGAGDTGGAVNFLAGNGASQGGGYVMTAGDGVSPGAVGGSFQIVAGSCGFIGGTGGNVIINCGASDTMGVVQIGSMLGTCITVTSDLSGAPMLGVFGAAPVACPTTSTASATFVAGTGTAINSASTFDGYTIAKVVKALRNVGVLA